MPVGSMFSERALCGPSSIQLGNKGSEEGTRRQGLAERQRQRSDQAPTTFWRQERRASSWAMSLGEPGRKKERPQQMSSDYTGFLRMPLKTRAEAES